ncbi:hypothetical protein K438DRAFT_1953180 [Mycena galopus ATCC 62051]|nr:hypothetical protein K438DRAFT_1953180 [Mycena galopus ATCC 62051]
MNTVFGAWAAQGGEIGTVSAAREAQNKDRLAELDLLAAIASAAPSAPTRVPLGSRDSNIDYYSFNTSHSSPVPEYHDYYLQDINYYRDTSKSDSYDIGSQPYVPIYDVNSGSDHSSPTSWFIGYKRPASPTPLSGTSPKRTVFDNSSFNWSSSAVPTLSTMLCPPDASSALAAPVKKRPGRPQWKPVPPPCTQSLVPAPAAPVSQPLPEAPGVTEVKQDVTKGNWSVEELSPFYEFCLGQDADAIFEKITLSSNKCWATFVGKVGIARSAKQMKNQWDTSLAIYKKLVPLLKITGGGADDDEHHHWDDKNWITGFLAQRAATGHDVDSLTAAKVKVWLTKGCYNDNPKADCEVLRSSAEALSDLKDLHADDDDNVDTSDDDVMQVDALKVPSTPHV